MHANDRSEALHKGGRPLATGSRSEFGAQRIAGQTPFLCKASIGPIHMIRGTRVLGGLSAIWAATFFSVFHVAADERPAVVIDKLLFGSKTSANIAHGLSFDLRSISRTLFPEQLELVPLPRVSHSLRPLRRITLWGGDCFNAELIDWKDGIAVFRLQNGQTVRIPMSTLAVLANPPGEIDVLDESFEAGSSVESDADLQPLMDQTVAADGQRSLKFTCDAPAYQCRFPEPLTAARIEFQFRLGIEDPSADSAEWQLEWSDNSANQNVVSIRTGPERQISIGSHRQRTEIFSQTVTVDDGWHSLIAIAGRERTRLIVDDATLATFATPVGTIRSIQFRSGHDGSKNATWVDGLQVRRITEATAQDRHITKDCIDNDKAILASDDELFGRLKHIDRTQITMNAFGTTQALNWNQIAGLAWRQPDREIHQRVKPMAGIVSQIELQPYVDRPEQPAESFYATVLRSDSKSIVVQHSLLGELTFPWSMIRRVRSFSVGRSILLDARRFHLGNSIRPDFHRELPDGTKLEIDFSLQEIPKGRSYLSVDVAELEAAGPTAPPGTPFLAALRAGHLITDVSVNDHRIGSLNSLLRFKSGCQEPERVRIEIPVGILKTGNNSIRLRQHPLKESGREFDDCEVGHFRLEFDLTDGN